jgi:hypothetical protein
LRTRSKNNELKARNNKNKNNNREKRKNSNQDKSNATQKFPLTIRKAVWWVASRWVVRERASLGLIVIVVRKEIRRG